MGFVSVGVPVVVLRRTMVRSSTAAIFSAFSFSSSCLQLLQHGLVFLFEFLYHVVALTEPPS